MKTIEIQNQINSSVFPVIGIGSTSAEIDILKSLISNLAEDSGMAYVIIERLDYPPSENLKEILASQTKIPVIEIVNEIILKPDHIFIIPENNFLVLENEKLQLQIKTRSSTTNNGLDLFYEALANSYKTYAAGLQISGSSFDGFAGLKKIKELGGATLSVLHKKGLHQNAVNEDFIDYFVEPHSIASKLAEIRNSYLVSHGYEEEEENKDISADEEQLFNEIVEIIHSKFKTNFHHYKHQTLRRRVAKRMVITHQESIEKYLNLLKNNAAEQNALFNDFLIPVTYFFRDKPFFDNLSSTVFPALIENLHKDKIRIWSAGCSTGEEAYSLAISLHQYLEQTQNQHIKVQIFASDLSEHCIAKARTGIYTQQDVKNISDKILQKYFIKRDNNYHLNKVVRDMCVFAVHDITRDAPFSQIDLISCRNVLIYFDSDLQNEILASFHYALKNKGFLFLGKSETVNNKTDLFVVVDKQVKIYSRKSENKQLKIPRFEFIKPSEKTEIIAETETSDTDYKKIAADVLLEQYSPAAVIINEELEIVHFHGDTSPFLQPASGKPSFNILNMVRDELGFELRNAILKSRNEKKNISGGHIAVQKQNFLTSFEVIYLPANSDLLLIIFCKVPVAHNQINNSELEKELEQLRGDFKRVTEEQQIYFEELQTTNEELLSNAEELQLVNEQLSVSAEELQSNNEELSCINDELRDRRQELDVMRNFYESMINTIREPLVIIDKNAIIQSANPSFYRHFKTSQEETEGVSIFEIGNYCWNIPEFKETVLKKLTQQDVVENFKIQFNLEDGIRKRMLLNASRIADSIPDEMILIALEDITDLEESNESVKNINQELLDYNKQLESFTAAASHNLLEPGHKIYMLGKRILDNEIALSEAGNHNMKRLLNAAVNLNQLLEDLIDYSKINFTDKEFKKTNLNTLVKKTLNELKIIINKRHAEISVDPLPVAFVIPSQIQKLFSNLLTNSIKYSQENAVPKIKIAEQEISADELLSLGADADRNYIKIVVSDNGIGFTQNYETLIFDPFYKLHSNEQHYGSGLGLTLVHKIVLNHKGYIQVSSEPQKGTSVSIYLPV
ncbi:hypothetical protein ASE21_11700 [Flavobacterium sp. Root901]|uniref:CheR family methyltransferase n=1 Tax=Flavobacterium sp. Root901 TaxID=1736605 RepID=UPI00071016B5|nr:CheR family methyltransferase [Flavobacterium sp. Root901]KRD10367.1 hypothetical protein ASE21_11700 [Flavobacterium sp. Root901]